MNILMLSSTFPYPPDRGRKQLRTFHLLKYLSNSHHVTFLTQRDEQISDEEVETLAEHVAELVIFPVEEVSESEGIIGKSQTFRYIHPTRYTS